MDSDLARKIDLEKLVRFWEQQEILNLLNDEVSTEFEFFNPIFFPTTIRKYTPHIRVSTLVRPVLMRSTIYIVYTQKTRNSGTRPHLKRKRF